MKPATPAEEELSIDRDGDGDTAVGFDDNHEGAPDLVGRPASAAERRAVAAIVDRYYRYALAGSARVACDLLYPTLEHSAAEDYGREPSVPYLHGGKSCQEILTRLFTHFHHRLSVLVPLLSVAAVRDVNDHAMVFLHFRGFPARELSLRRYRGSWRLSDLIDYAVT